MHHGKQGATIALAFSISSCLRSSVWHLPEHRRNETEKKKQQKHQWKIEINGRTLKKMYGDYKLQKVQSSRASQRQKRIIADSFLLGQRRVYDARHGIFGIGKHKMHKFASVRTAKLNLRMPLECIMFYRRMPYSKRIHWHHHRRVHVVCHAEVEWRILL